MRAEAHDGVFPVHAADDGFQRSFQVGEGDALIHHEALDLVEERRVRGVHRVRAVDAAGADDADGRLLLLHHAHLHRRGLGAQQDLVVDIERVLRVARRVVLRHVQRLEIVVVVFHLRPAHDVEPEADEDLLDFIQLDAQRVLVAQLPGRAGQGDVDLFALQALLRLRFAQLLRAGGELRFDLGADPVRRLPHGGALLRGKPAHLLQNGRQLPLFAEVADAQAFQRLPVRGPAQITIRRFADGLQFLLECHGVSVLSFRSYAENKKAFAPPRGESYVSRYHPVICSFRPRNGAARRRLPPEGFSGAAQKGTSPDSSPQYALSRWHTVSVGGAENGYFLSPSVLRSLSLI